MKIPAILFVCLALTEFSQQAPRETKKIEWSPWMYVETRNQVELHWRRCEDPAQPRIQFGLKNKNTHDVEVRFLEHAYLYEDGSYEPRPSTSLMVPGQQNRGQEPDVLKRMPKTWNLNWEVRKLR